MSAENEHNPLLEFLLAGTPDCVLDAVIPDVPEVRAQLDGARELLAQIALSLEPVEPSAALRSRVEAAIAARPVVQPRKALVVLDMIEDYLTPGRPLFQPRALEIVPAVRASIDRARAAGTPVVYLCDRHEAGDPELEKWPTHALAGTGGDEVVSALAPLPGERVIGHRTFSGFFETEFDAVLRGLGVDTLVLTGCSTEVGVLATATDALMRGYKVEVPIETQAGATEAYERMVLTVLSVIRPLAPMSATG